ncbi:MAG: TonB-dependent receptor [Cyclobacteriaceae bacterium]
MKKHLPLFVLLFLAGLSAQSQAFTQTVKGRIIDQQSKRPIVGATVLVKDSDPLQGSTTDVNGYFRIASVPIGRQTLVFSSVGYQSKTIPNITVSSGKETMLEIDLIESLIQMEEVVIVADKQEKGQPQNEMATVSSISLSVEETSRTPATFGDPARAALSQPGVATGGDDLLNEIVIRGNSPKGILWRLEGVEIPNPNHFASVGSSAGGISMLSSSVLSNSDFFTAAFPAQYGNASSGIFDLKMRNGNFDKREYSFQSGLLGIQASVEGPFSERSNASYLINYRYSTLGLFSAIGLDILGEEENVTFQDISFKFNIPTKKMGRFSIWGLGGRNTYGGDYLAGKNFKRDSVYAAYYVANFGPNPDSIAYWTENERDLQHMGAAGVTHTIYMGKNTYLESVLSMTGHRTRFTYDSMMIRRIDTELIEESAVRLSSLVNHKFNSRNTLRVGGIVSRLNYDLNSVEWWSGDRVYNTYLDESGHTYFYQAFAQWQHRLSERLTLNSGVHSSYFGLNGNTYIEPRLGFRYQKDKQVAYTGGFGLHSRMETISLYMAQQKQEDGSYVQHNKDLGFSKAAHFVLGVEKMIKPDFRFKSEVYYQHLYDVPVWPLDTGTAFFGSISMINQYDGYTDFKLANKGTGSNYGIEFTWEKFFTSDHYFMVNTSLYSSRYEGIDGVRRNTVFNGNYIFNMLGGKEYVFRNGRRVLNLNARLIVAGGKREAPINLEASRNNGFTVRDYTRNFENKLDPYWRVDFGANYKINRPKTAYVLSLNIQNLFAVENEYARYYANGKVQSAGQLGFFPNFSYRIEF